MAAPKPVKKVQNAVLYDNGWIKIENVRASHPHLDKPYKAPKDADNPKVIAKYSVTGLLSKKTHREAMQLCLEEINRICREKKLMRIDEAGKERRTIKADALFLRDGDEEGKAELAGNWTVSSRETNAPILRKKVGGQAVNVERADAAQVFYGGCYVDVVIEPWAQNNEHGKRINSSLRMVMFRADGEAFGKGHVSEDDADGILDVEDDGDGASGAAADEDEDAL